MLSKLNAPFLAQRLHRTSIRTKQGSRDLQNNDVYTHTVSIILFAIDLDCNSYKQMTFGALQGCRDGSGLVSANVRPANVNAADGQ